ncbi:MAG: hypothetical protein DYH08_18795, partial [Actinobacteria bacterium ATB1]|nr:hypothetical protein [Actinobacteria bacterium ATB1]
MYDVNVRRRPDHGGLRLSPRLAVQLRPEISVREVCRAHNLTVERVYDDEYLRRYDIDGAGERRGPYIGHDTRLISQLYGIGQTRHSYTAVSFVGIQDLREDLLLQPVVQPVIAPYFETDHVMRDPLLGGQLQFNANAVALLRN